MITAESAFLSFVCMVTAIEALSGYRYGDINLEKRFTDFITAYFPESYKRYATDLYKFRKKMVHSFSTDKFVLTHHASDRHLEVRPNGGVVLNAEDFYSALVTAAQKYFEQIRSDKSLEATLVKRVQDPHNGGSIGVFEF